MYSALFKKSVMLFELKIKSIIWVSPFSYIYLILSFMSSYCSFMLTWALSNSFWVLDILSSVFDNFWLVLYISVAKLVNFLSTDWIYSCASDLDFCSLLFSSWACCFWFCKSESLFFSSLTVPNALIGIAVTANAATRTKLNTLDFLITFSLSLSLLTQLTLYL